MINKKILSVSACLMFVLGAYSNGRITGKVFDKVTSAPMDYVSVTLINAADGSTLPIGCMTDAEGVFTLDNITPGKYIVKITNIGNLPQEREVVIADADINLGNIFLTEDAKLLEEVVVVGQKSQMTLGSETRVFNVSSNISSSGSSAEELLAAVPSVDVNSDGDISLRGKTDVLVLIDGKVMGMNADNRSQILRQIPAESIAAIEVMTNPSSKNSTEGTAGIINIRLKEDKRHGYFGSAEADVDSHGSVNLNANINYNEGKFETFAGIGLKSHHSPGGTISNREYDEGYFLNSDGKNRKHENSMFLRLGTNYNYDENNKVYLSAIGTVGHKRAHTNTLHTSNLPDLWQRNFNVMKESGDTRGANILLGYKHSFALDHYIDANLSYNIWVGPNDNLSYETESWADNDMEEETELSQHQDVKISNWEAAIDYSSRWFPWLKFEAGYKGNYNHENSPASYSEGQPGGSLTFLPQLYNRFIYNTDISALYINFSGNYSDFTFSAGLRGEAWQIRTRSLGYDEVSADIPWFKKNDFALFPSASFGWTFLDHNELKINYSRRIRRPYGPQLNTFENIADPSEVHLGNPTIQPEYSNSVELSYIRNWSKHTLSVTGFMRSNNDMISHVSFLAPMASNPDVNTMYYGHANVGNMVNTGVEIISRNNLFSCLTLTTTVNLYNCHLKAWQTDYPLHDVDYPIYGARQDKFVWDVRCMASLRLPWDLTLQATGRYSSRRVEPQGIEKDDWDVEAGLRKSLGAWDVSVICKDIFDSKKSRNVLYGNGYTQTIDKWQGGRTFRLAVSYSFGKVHKHDHDHDDDHYNEINTGGYGEGGHNHQH